MPLVYGLPLAVMELTNPTGGQATIWCPCHRFQTVDGGGGATVPNHHESWRARLALIESERLSELWLVA